MAKSKIVVLDPGHGGRDVGAVGYGRREADEVLQLALAVRQHLVKRGITVHMTRDSDTYVELHSRPMVGSRLAADAFVSLHRNAHDKPSSHGTEVWIHPQAVTSQLLAMGILERLVQIGISANRGIKKGGYAVLQSSVPSVLVELGFITNAADNLLFDRNFSQYAENIAAGICEFLGVRGEDIVASALFRVQIGAFTQQDNARAFLQQVREMGLEAYLVLPEEESQPPLHH